MSQTENVFSRISGTLTFKRDVVESIEHDESLNQEATLIMVLVWLVGIFVGVATPYIGGETAGYYNIEALSLIIGELIYNIGGGLAFIGACAFIGQLIGGRETETDFMEIFRVIAYAYAAKILDIIWFIEIFVDIPFTALLPFIFWIWVLIATIYVLMAALDKGAFTAIVTAILAAICLIFILGAVTIIIYGTLGDPYTYKP
ncbi:MAG: YIP1 family protein [Promethearchaeota archaeon]